ncbi:hypothetical protein EV2_039972 [Malus domestica]
MSPHPKHTRTSSDLGLGLTLEDRGTNRLGQEGVCLVASRSSRFIVSYSVVSVCSGERSCESGGFRARNRGWLGFGGGVWRRSRREEELNGVGGGDLSSEVIDEGLAIRESDEKGKVEVLVVKGRDEGRGGEEGGEGEGGL